MAVYLAVHDFVSLPQVQGLSIGFVHISDKVQWTVGSLVCTGLLIPIHIPTGRRLIRTSPSRPSATQAIRCGGGFSGLQRK